MIFQSSIKILLDLVSRIDKDKRRTNSQKKASIIQLTACLNATTDILKQQNDLHPLKVNIVARTAFKLFCVCYWQSEMNKIFVSTNESIKVVALKLWKILFFRAPSSH